MIWLLLAESIPEPIADKILLNTVGWITAIISTIIGVWASRRKNKAEIQKLSTESEVSIAKVTMDFMAVIKKDLHERNCEYEDLKRHSKLCEEDLAKIKRIQEANKTRLDRLESYVRDHDGPLLAEELRKILRSTDRH